VSDTNQQTRQRYLQRIEVYKSFGYDRPAAVRYAVDRLEPFEGSVLDVGTGQGLLAIELARRGSPVVSIDVSEEEQRVGKANADSEDLSQRITFLTLDAQTLPFPDGTFGAVATLDALHHLADGPAVFSEMRRVLEPSGRILLAELTSDGFALVARVHESEGRVHPVGPVTVSSAVDWFVSNGFRLIGLEEGHLHSVAVLEKPE
jgi:ubiquinone/menaquinone biosynthesis C-methylase UbiE